MRRQLALPAPPADPQQANPEWPGWGRWRPVAMEAPPVEGSPPTETTNPKS